MTLTAGTDMGKLQELSARKYSDQAVFFLNSTWDTHGEKNAEQIWKYAAGFAELDEKNGKEGCELDELNSHKFLERHGETLTVRELREILRKIDIDTNKNVSLSEYLIYRFTIDWPSYVNTIQGDQEAVNKAMAMLTEAQARLADAQEKQSAARQAENAARNALAAAESAEAKATASEAAARDAANKATAAAAAAAEAEARVKAATEEVVAAKLKVDAAVAELHAQQSAYDNKLATLEARGNDESLGLVARNKARNELAQAKNEDPLPLQRAKITAEAEQRKHEKLSKAAFEERARAEKAAEESRIAAEAATAEATRAANELRAAQAARQASEEATARAVAARHASDAALEAAQAAFKEAEDYLEEAKNTIPNGRLWWIDRELFEAKKYMPQSKGGIARS